MNFKKIFLELLYEDSDGNQSLFSKKTGIPIPTVNGWLTKDKLPRAEQLITLARYFHVTTDYLLGLDKEMPKGEFACAPYNETAEKKKQIAEKIKRLNKKQLDFVAETVDFALKNL